jgi:hypothetical protein
VRASERFRPAIGGGNGGVLTLAAVTVALISMRI